MHATIARTHGAWQGFTNKHQNTRSLTNIMCHVPIYFVYACCISRMLWVSRLVQWTPEDAISVLQRLHDMICMIQTHTSLCWSEIKDDTSHTMLIVWNYATKMTRQFAPIVHIANMIEYTWRKCFIQNNALADWADAYVELNRLPAFTCNTKVSLTKQLYSHTYKLQV